MQTGFVSPDVAAAMGIAMVRDYPSAGSALERRRRRDHSRSSTSSMLAVDHIISQRDDLGLFGSAANNVTPRATRLLREDLYYGHPVTSVSTVYRARSCSRPDVGISVVLKTALMVRAGRVVLFIVTIGVIALIVISRLCAGYLDYLAHFGETTKRVEDAAARSDRSPSNDRMPAARRRAAARSRSGESKFSGFRNRRPLAVAAEAVGSTVSSISTCRR